MISTGTINVIIGCVLTFVGALILAVLGIGVGYIKSINKTLKEIYGINVKHEEQIEGIFTKRCTS